MQLKPCPFCGCEATLLDDVNIYGIFSRAVCSNPSCSASIAFRNELQTVEAWNNRPHGVWTLVIDESVHVTADDHCWECSNCQEWTYIPTNPIEDEFFYCPICGAEMEFHDEQIQP